MSKRTKRAAPLSADERRAMILDAAIPLLAKHGSDVTTRQIATAAGIAEGTVFRVFDDKAALIEAALERFVDPSRMRAEILALDPNLPLETLVGTIYRAFREHTTGLLGLMAAVGMKPPKISSEERDAFLVRVGALLAHGRTLRVDPTMAARLVRMVAFANAVDAVYKTEGVPDDVAIDSLLFGVSGREA